MGTINVTAEDFRTTIEDHDIVLFDLVGVVVRPVPDVLPVFEKAAAAHPDITFVKVDTEAESGLAGAMGIRSIPTLMVFREGVLVFSQPGALPSGVLEELIAKVRQLDMAQVHRAAATQAAPRARRQAIQPASARPEQRRPAGAPLR